MTERTVVAEDDWDAKFLSKVVSQGEIQRDGSQLILKSKLKQQVNRFDR